ncbi:hypothetical protein BDV38DRAFT_279827 [Aspergillus pseudotamarii]|uniref:Xylanolytic transcriptional activator regulatory domain-containing protein n=1 Tax=Aspergillus pseudotamarii TaxID=132259 RepID=A0A5N6T3G6_ASPPS|nr:uncharacterized protein BDV38DRAFT_279827 [Aspergillus pseudotamarii]KAE8140853.1 hypothetical protein BDV38DRAFT_279827 [Aspergillus pseudotamarii]
MAFLRFRLEAANRPPAPVPIAAAVSRPRPRGQDGNVQHHSRPGIGPQAVSDEKQPPICDGELPGGCLRCLRRNKECILYPPSQIASVENPTTRAASRSSSPKLHAQQPHSGTAFFDRQGAGERHELDDDLDMDAPATFQGEPTNATWSSHPLSCSRSEQFGRMMNSILSPEIAEQIFHEYVDNFAPKCPVVMFPTGTTAALVRETKPLLFLSIISIASAGYCSAAQQRDLTVKAKFYLANRAIVRGEKSLELVQALQVAAFWYRAPDDYKQMNLSQLASIATTMAIDLGLDTLEASKPAGTAEELWDRVEAQRAWLGCLLLSASLSLILRRPNSLAWSPQYDDYVADLRRAKVSPTDELLCTIVTTESICHAIHKELFLSDPVSSVCLSDSKISIEVQKHKSQIESLPLNQISSLDKSLVEFGSFASLLYLHEPILHVNDNIVEFKAPFSVKSLETCNFIDTHDFDPSFLFMLRTIIRAAQGLLDCFLRLSTSDMMALPPHIYGGRVIYAMILLLKVQRAITLSGRAISECVTSDELRIEMYLEHLVRVSKRLIAEDDRSALSRAFLFMPQLMQWWHSYQTKTLPRSDETEMTEGLSFRTGDGPLSPAAQTPRATVCVPSTHTQTPIITHLEPMDGLGQSDALTQPTKASDDPNVHNEGPEFEPYQHELASDSWFWEFFNVDMLHQNDHSS